jgi:GntR family transcriptional repressor for pyruvate dehydrogenase complex
VVDPQTARRFAPARPVRVYERVVQQIEEAIYLGQLRPGERLPSERELMTQFAVSRGTIREALRVLQSAGLVQSRPGDPRGPEVLPFSTTGIHKSMSALARVEHLGLGELVQFRMLVEGECAALAAAGRTEQQLTALESTVTDMKAAVVLGPEAFGAADVAFRDLVAEISGNKLLRVCTDVVREVARDLLARNTAYVPDGVEGMRLAVRRQRRVLTAIHERAAGRAETLVKRHLYDYYREYVSPAELPALELTLGQPAPRRA